MGVLEGKVAVVTGSGRGIGREIVLLMASEGAKVVVNDLGGTGAGQGETSAVADEVVAEIKSKGGEAAANYASVATAEGAESIIQTAIDKFGKIDILVNNAGILRDRMIWNMSDEEWDSVIKVHLYGHFYCSRAAIRNMRDAIREGKQTNGRVINFASDSGIRGNAGQANYAAAKMGVVGFTLSVALACERMGITVNAVSPKAMTRLTDTIPDDRARQLAKQRGIAGWDSPDIADVKQRLIGGPPASIAPIIVWLASDEAQRVTGNVFSVFGGELGLFTKMERGTIAFHEGIYSVPEVGRAMEVLVPKPTEAQ